MPFFMCTTDVCLAKTCDGWRKAVTNEPSIGKDSTTTFCARSKKKDERSPGINDVAVKPNK
jgi:hypothetical protein